nr:MAG TPA: hypothetical protein [Caudoviricetes sp.]
MVGRMRSMNKQENTKRQLYRELRDVLSAYIQMFEDKHEVDMQYSVDDELIGELCFGDAYFFHIADVVYDIDHDLPKGLILQWAEDSVDDSKNPTRQTINLHSYAQGLRFEDLEENKRCNSKRQKKKKE